MSAETEESIDLKSFFAILWRSKWMILAFVALSQVLLAYKYVRTPVRYLADSKFIFKSAESESPLSGIAAIMGIRTPSQSGTNISSFFEIILFTDEFLAPLLERKWKVGDDSLTLAEVWKMPPQTGGYAEFRAKVGKLLAKEYIMAKKEPRTGVVSLETRFEKPELTYEVNLYLINQLNEYLLNQTKSQASENRKFVDRRLVEVAAELKNSEESMLAFNLRNRTVGSPELLLQMARLRRAVEINQEVYLQLKKELEMAKINERKENPVIQILSRPKLPLGPESRLPLKNYLIATLGGILLGVFFALLLHFLKPAQLGPKG